MVWTEGIVDPNSGVNEQTVNATFGAPDSTTEVAGAQVSVWRDRDLLAALPGPLAG